MKIIGLSMIFILFMALFMLAGKTAGWKAASIIFSISFASTAWILLAAILIAN